MVGKLSFASFVSFGPSERTEDIPPIFFQPNVFSCSLVFLPVLLEPEETILSSVSSLSLSRFSPPGHPIPPTTLSLPRTRAHQMTSSFSIAPPIHPRAAASHCLVSSFSVTSPLFSTWSWTLGHPYPSRRLAVLVSSSSHSISVV